MTQRRRVLLRVGLPAGGAAILALTISLVLALTSSAAPVKPLAKSELYPHPRAWPAVVQPHVVTRLYSPFTGEPVRALKPVLAVKIDNIVDARPQTGLQSADLIYVIPVEGGQLGGPTVVIQYTVVKTSRFLEYGSRPPYAVSTGSGQAVVLRDGRAFDVRWSRPSADGGTTFTLPSGQRMAFAPGQVWVVLASSPKPATP